MVSSGKFYFLSRPRRFGKSLLCSTLEAFFAGRRELFEEFTTEEGVEQPQLFIATTRWKWEKHPVIRFDFSQERELSLNALDQLIDRTLTCYEHLYGINPQFPGFNLRLMGIIEEAHQQTGRRAVVIVDEYDNFMLHSIGDKELETEVRKRFSSLFSPLKSLDDHLRFVFITGISKFSQMGIFSTLNNLTNISMTADYETLCGITEEELTTQLRPDIEQLAMHQGENYEETLAKLKRMYDGYHFSRIQTDIYNPFSLFNALQLGEVGNYWFSSATPSALIGMLGQMPPIELTDIDGVVCPSDDFDVPFDSYDSYLPVLYQSGYLTIKNYRREYDEYTLGFPNAEVRQGFARCLYQHVMAEMGHGANIIANALRRSYHQFCSTGDLAPFIEAIQALFAAIPYHLVEKSERYYHSLLLTLFTSYGADITAEEPSAKGRADLVLRMPIGIYIFELKLDGTADAALAQIRDRGYARKYLADGRPVTFVGMTFSSAERNITEWQSEEMKI